MEEFLSPTPSRLDLTPLPLLAWLATAALLLGFTEGVGAEDVAILAAFAAAAAAPVFAATRATDVRSFFRRAAAGGVAAGLAAALAIAAKSEEFFAAGLVTAFFLAAVAFPVGGALLHAPLLLLIRSVRSRAWARHRGREALVSGLVGLAALAWLLARAPEMFRARGFCACEGPVRSPATQLAAYAMTAGAVAALTAFLVARGLRWEARVRPLLRAALAGALPGWSVTDATRRSSRRALALNGAPSWSWLQPTRAADDADPYRAADLHAPAVALIPSRLRRVGATQVLNALLLAALVGLCAAIGRAAHVASQLPHHSLGP